MTPTIYTISANPAIDLFLDVPAIVPEEVLRATHVRRVWAGKGFNVSRAVRRLGLPTLALGFVAGYAGLQIRDGLEAEGIPTDFVTVEGETRTNVMILDTGNGQHIKVNQPGAPVDAAACAAFIDRMRAHLTAGDYWVLTGSLSPGMAPTFYAELIELIHAAGAYAVLDSSGAALRAGCGARPDLVKPNTAEARDLTGQAVTTPTDELAAVEAFHAAGARRVALSLGAAGVLYSDGGQRWRVQPPRLDVRTAVGAGDALLGGLVWALATGHAPPDVARWGVATGSVYALADDLPDPAPPAVRAMLDRLTVTPLASAPQDPNPSKHQTVSQRNQS
jgi:1-phosphofructokinase family hexose kinase